MNARSLAWSAAAAGAAILLGALTWGLAHPAGSPADSVMGQPAPDVTVQRLDDGRVVKLSDFRGHPVVLNFWASWCAPCHQEEGALKVSAERWGGSVAFLGVDIQDSPAAARAYQAQVRYPYPVGPAPSGVTRAYGVTAPPETFFIDKRGVVAARFVGPLDSALIDRYLQLVGVNS